MQYVSTLTVLVVLTCRIHGDFRPPAVPLIVFSPHISGKLSCVDNEQNDAYLSLNRRFEREKNKEEK
jgi:hypothetical protein